MSSKEVRHEVEGEVKEFFARSSIHGLAYFFSEFSLVERLFWVIVTIAMLASGSVWVNTALNDWAQNPTVLNTEISSTLEAIQFPTITICPNFAPDKWGFLRNVMNALKFSCNSDIDCSQTYHLKRLLDYSNRDSADSFPPFDTVSDVFNHLRLVAYYAWPRYNDTLTAILQQHEVIRKMSISIAVLPYYPWYNKLKNKRNNYGVLRKANNSEPRAALDLSDQAKSSALLSMLLLAMPLLGPVGSLFIHTHAYMFYANPHDWFFETHYNWPEDQSHINDYFFDILNGFFNDSTIDVSAMEVSSILQPVPTFIAHHRFPRQFPHTMRRHEKKTRNLPFLSRQRSTGLASDVASAHRELPKIWELKNYFGKLLGPHLLKVMEVMRHCQLQPRPTTPKRLQTHPQIYGDLDQVLGYLRYPQDFDPFFPTWKDYKGMMNDTPYLIPFTSDPDGYFLYENGPNPEFRSTYEGAIDPDRDSDLTEMRRAIYSNNQMMIICQDPTGNETDCRDKFYPVYTDLGICYSYNAPSFQESIKKNTYSEIFQTVYEPSMENTTVMMETSSGKTVKMFLVLNSHLSKVYENVGGRFHLGVNPKFDFSNMRDTSIEVQNGFITNLRVTPIQYSASNNFKNLAIHERKCRLVNENSDPQSLFQFYTQRTCQFECRLRESRNHCGCTPWNYPQYILEDDITEICDGQQAHCFENVMDKIPEGCDCLPDCEKIVFKKKSDQHRINYRQECNLDAGETSANPSALLKNLDMAEIIGEQIRFMEGEEYNFWLERLKQTVDPEKFVHDLLVVNKYYRYVQPNLVREKCLELMQSDYVFISIEVTEPDLTTLQSDVAVDFITKIATIGGTIGLFTGMSLLSMVEVGFWICRAMAALVQRKKVN